MNADGTFAPIEELESELEKIHEHMDKFADFMNCLKAIDIEEIHDHLGHD